MNDECLATPDELRRFGIWSNVSKTWMLDTTGRLISYTTMHEARAHIAHTTHAHTELPEWSAMEIGANGLPILRAEDVQPPRWNLKRSQQTPY